MVPDAIPTTDPAREESHYWGDVPAGYGAIEDDATGACPLFCRSNRDGSADRPASYEHSRLSFL